MDLTFVRLGFVDGLLSTV